MNVLYIYMYSFCAYFKGINTNINTIFLIHLANTIKRPT